MDYQLIVLIILVFSIDFLCLLTLGTCLQGVYMIRKLQKIESKIK